MELGHPLLCSSHSLGNTVSSQHLHASDTHVYIHSGGLSPYLPSY